MIILSHSLITLEPNNNHAGLKHVQQGPGYLLAELPRAVDSCTLHGLVGARNGREDKA